MILDPQAIRLATPQEAAQDYDTTIGYVYKLARRDQWRRIRHEGRVYYDLNDIDRTLGKD
jgi:hypothetical protein